jgi:hypothetical protein
LGTGTGIFENLCFYLFVNYYLNVLAWTQNKKHFFRFSRRFSCLRQCRKVNNFDAAPALCKDFDAAPAPVPDKNFDAPVPGNNLLRLHTDSVSDPTTKHAKILI